MARDHRAGTSREIFSISQLVLAVPHQEQESREEAEVLSPTGTTAFSRFSREWVEQETPAARVAMRVMWAAPRLATGRCSQYYPVMAGTGRTEEQVGLEAMRMM